MAESQAMLMGKLIEATDDLRRDVEAIRNWQEEDRHDSAESRKSMREKLEEFNEAMRDINSTLISVGGIATQTRDLHAVLEEKINKEIMPAIALVNGLKKDGRNWLVAAGIVGSAISTAVGGLMYSNWDKIWEWVKATF